MADWDVEKGILVAVYAIIDLNDLFVSGLQFWMWWLPLGLPQLK